MGDVKKYRALDLFCCAGGAGMGLHRAGFDVVGVDIVERKRYPFTFHQADAMTFPLDGYDLIWASPPCQSYCALNGREDLSGYPDLVGPVREMLENTGLPFVIENVPGAPIRKDLMLCGGMFGLRSYRHRYFEANFTIPQPEHPKHEIRVNARGQNRREHWANGGFLTITGDVGTYCGPEAMGIDWMSGAEMSEAIPPAYAEHIGRAAIKAIQEKQFGAGVALAGKGEKP
jgi:DNA (cytosine-5)-methyltransferase 1